MAKFVMVGMQQYLNKLGDLSRTSVGVCKMGVYDGAAVMAKAISNAIDGIPTIKPRRWREGEPKLAGLMEAQKIGLKDSLGIAKIKSEGGVVNTHVGFDGYNHVTTKKYPHGQPNALIARSIESGTSFRVATHFASKAIRSATAECEAAMKKTVETTIEKIMEE